MAPSAASAAPVFVVAPAAHDLLQQNAGGCGDWLRAALAARVLVPGDACRHSAMAASGALRVCACASGNNDGADLFAAARSEPCVVVASHASCTRGDNALLLARFGRTAQAAVVLVDSRLPPAFVAAAHPHEALRCGLCIVPLDTALAANDAELAHTLAHHAPHALVLARQAVADALAAAGVPEHALTRLPDSGGRCAVSLPAVPPPPAARCRIEHELASKWVAVRRVCAGLEHTAVVGVLPTGTVAQLQPDSTCLITSTAPQRRRHARRRATTSGCLGTWRWRGWWRRLRGAGCRPHRCTAAPAAPQCCASRHQS